MVSHRFGLLDGKQKTLEAIGRKNRLSRELIRQLIDRSVPLLARHPKLDGLCRAFEFVMGLVGDYAETQVVARVMRSLSDLSFDQAIGAKQTTMPSSRNRRRIQFLIFSPV